MNKPGLVFLLAIATVVSSFICKKLPPGRSGGFVITGSIQGYADSTQLFLEDESGDSRKMIDSTMIINGHFKFTGSIQGNASYSLIHTKDFGDYTFFWLENKAISFAAEKGKFHYATISGSAAQDDENELAVLTDPFEKGIDSLNGLPKKSLSEQARAALLKRIDSLRGEELAANINFIKAHPASIVSAKTLDVYASGIGKEKATRLYNSFSNENKQSQYGSNVLKYITLNKDLKIGDHYVDFSARTPQGALIKISDYAGKVVLIDFWASWCGPCRKENPELVKTYAGFQTKGFEIVGVSLDNESGQKDWITAIEKDGLVWPNISDLKGDKSDAALIYGVTGIPDNFLIDKNGIIIARNLRGEALRDKLKTMLK